MDAVMLVVEARRRGTWATSWRSALVLIFMPRSTSAIWLILKEWGPATLTTTGAFTCSPSASTTPSTRPARRGISTTAVLKRKTAPAASAAT
jgi:hypothetical protein